MAFNASPIILEGVTAFIPVVAINPSNVGAVASTLSSAF
jgi:hypothetical protein